MDLKPYYLEKEWGFFVSSTILPKEVI